MSKPILPSSHHASPLFKWDDGDPEVNFRSAREQASANDDFDDIKSFPLASRLIALIWIASIAIVGWVLYVAYHAIQGAS